MNPQTKLQNRFPRSEVHPRRFIPENNAEYICQNIALTLGEKDMQFILARLHQFNGNVYPLELAFAAVKDAMRLGKVRNPRALFNHLVSNALGAKH